MKKIRMRLMVKLFLSYMLIFILLAATIVLIYKGYTHRMNEYFKMRTEEALQQVVEEFQTAYEDNPKQIQSVEKGIQLITNNMGFGIRFTNPDGEVVYIYNEFDQSRQPPPAGLLPGKFDREMERVEKNYDIVVDGVEQGVLTISYLGEHNLNNNDRQLLDVIKRTYQMILLSLIMLGILVSAYLSRSITKPMKMVARTANKIQQGELLARANVNTSTIEIQELSDAINYLGDTLQKEDTLRKQMTSDMAHEIRTPLTALRNFFEAFIDGVIEPDAHQLGKCYDEILRMAELVERLKDIAALEETHLILHNESFNLTQEIDNLIDLMTPQFYKKNTQVVMRLEKNVMVCMDRNKVNQMLMNLLSNANRYTDAGGMITVVLKQGPKTTQISVTDTGIGISKEDLPFIFERFYRSDKSRSRDTGGMGVGLTIVKQLVELYHGRIRVESNLGSGSSFEIEFDNDHISNK